MNFYKALIRIRKAHSTFIEGKYELVMPDDAQIYAYTRIDENGEFLIICNLTGEEAHFTEAFNLAEKKLLLGNYETFGDEPIELLRPYEARLYQVK